MADCKYGDPTCPCQDGDPCHYEGENAMNVPPNPGSDAAIADGCTCPVMDNGHGSQSLGDSRGFWVTAGCPIHANTGKGAEAVANWRLPPDA